MLRFYYNLLVKMGHGTDQDISVRSRAGLAELDELGREGCR